MKKGLRKIFEGLYVKYNHRELIKPDPLQFVYSYSEPADMEVAGFIASSLAYGRVGQIEKSVSELLGRMGGSPADFIKSFDKSGRKKLAGFRHRFTDGGSLSDLFELLRDVLVEYGSIEKFFVLGLKENDANIIGALSEFCGSLLERYTDRHDGHVSRGLKYLLVDPENGSACKRLNLFLRWMVRSDDVDAGLWKSVGAEKLIVPVDVHMGRLCKILGLYEQKTVSLSAAVAITESFKKIEPDDPVKYDFALSRIGIVENCNGRFRLECEGCELLDICKSK